MTIETGGRLPPTSYAPPQVSWGDFLDWVLGIEGRAEWVDGEIIGIAGENVRHHLIVGFLHILVTLHAERHRLGLVFAWTFLMKMQHRPTGRMPDLMFLANEHRERLQGTYLDGPADLAVEVVSPDSEVRDRREKMAEYEVAGVREYWLIDEPRREAYFYTLDRNGRYREALPSVDGIYASTVLPGLRLRVDWLWRDPLPTFDEALADLPA